ncbi:RHS repeat domain-containing protein [Sphingomonas pruni]|uniref:RHS repeat domain-containing protein n=1 Tax=Sphingomonas pruni TaxID=40683 RepID=UPI000A07440C|nr:RHS repeat-associated core domain-containing protein [Sphingomonas pruni]
MTARCEGIGTGRPKRSNQRLSKFVFLLSASAVSYVASIPTLHAQTIPSIPGPPVFPSTDENGVNIANGSFQPPQQLAAIGPSESQLKHVISGVSGVSGDSNLTGVINTAPGQICGGGGCTPATMYKVSIDGQSNVFAKPTNGNPSGIITTAYFNSRGQSLSYDSTTQTYTHTDRQGTINIFSKPLAATSTGWTAFEGVLVSRQFKNGEKWTYNWVSCGSGCSALSSVVSNRGYMLKYSYPQSTSNQLSSVTALDQSIDYCDPNAPTCSYSRIWPSSTITSSPSSISITDELNHTTLYALTNGKITNITSPAGVQVGVIYDANGRVSSITRSGVTWIYTYGSNYTQVTGPDGLYKQYTIDAATGNVSAIRDRAGNTTSKTLDQYGLLSQFGFPEGNSENFQRDNNGNLTQYTAVPKSGSPLPNITMSQVPSSFDDKPSSITDAMNQTTDFTYDPQTGLTTSVTLPAASTGAVRPQTRISYGQIPTYAKNASGNLVQVGSIWSLTGTSRCATQATCAGTADETKTIVSYAGSNHALPTATTIQSGDGTVSSTQSVSYDGLGNLASVSGPLGAAQTTVYRYDAHGHLIGEVGPDPDGSGPRKLAATKTTFNADGMATLTQVGTVTDQTDAAWANFSESRRSATTLDVNGRAIRQSVAAGGTTYGVTDTLYDNLGRPNCTIQYMDLAAVGAPASSCAPVQTSGPYGPDRVSLTTFDPNGQKATISESVGTSSPVVTATFAYSANGKIKSISDGRNNLTSYTYDGFDRLGQTNYPSPTSPGASSTTDYEKFTYDANGNVIGRQLRDGTLVGFSYDNLNRVKAKTPPNGEPTVSYTYDLVGHLLTASSSGQTLTSGYDALGRTTTAAQAFGSLQYQYNVAGNRTRVTWPDGFYVAYDYDLTGNMTAVRENGATTGVGVLASYSYDDLGRRTSVTRGNGTVTYFSYDVASRLICLRHDLAGGGTLDCTPTANGQDNATTFTYNPASQIASASRANGAYAWTGAVTVTRPYTSNGLNQYSAAGTTNLGYDARGNLTSSGTTTYTYTSDNRLKSMSGGPTLYYDPIGRLSEYDTASSTRFVYDGGEIATEVGNPSGAVLRRYVTGTNADEPLVWYEGAGTSDRRWLIPDERGSIVAVTDGTGNSIATNSYDEYGIPGGAKSGRFLYTGQAWFPELGMYYYKARMYSASLGRFIQTDPAGYADGTNWYNYVGGDPVNLVDPSGLATFQLQDCNNNISGPSTSNSAGDVVLTQTTCTSYYVTFPDAGPVATQFFGGGNGEGGGEAGSCYGSNGTACGVFKPRTKVDMCMDESARESGIALVLDLAGFIPGESQAVALFQLGVASGAIINGTFHGDFFGMSAGGVAYANTTASQGVKVGSQAARAIPGIGIAVNGVATIHDVISAVKAFNRCMARK